MRNKKILITIDVEPDCPPFLSTTNGILVGVPALLDLFSEQNITATFFTTGQIAQQFPEIIDRIVHEKHELGCHGHTHNRFDKMSLQEAAYEIKTSAEILRKFAPVISFRAPYLQFPDPYLPLLIDHGFQIDSSIQNSKKIIPTSIIQRIPITLPYACYRFPFYFPRLFSRQQDTEVMFMHPWEFIDMSNANIAFHRRFNTGNYALSKLKKWIRFFKSRNDQFVTMDSNLSRPAKQLITAD